MATKSAAQQKAERKSRYNAFIAACPSRDLLNLISSKWVTLVLCALGGGVVPANEMPTGRPRPLRHAELSRHLGGVSQKMLTQTLRSLERDGLISRTVTPTVPVSVTYQLTELGLSLHQVIGGIKAWAEAHTDDILHRRSTFDAPISEPT